MHDSALLSVDGLAIEETSPPIAILRARGATTALFDRLSAALDVRWPATPNAISGGVCWLGPCEWAIIGFDAQVLDREISAACAGVPCHLAHIGDGKRRWRVSGRLAPEFFARGACLDFHPQAFAAATCAQTLFAQVPALIVRRDLLIAFDLVIDASYATYVRAWIDAAVLRMSGQRHGGAS